MSVADYDVAIIGGGPCGLLAALLLARRGVRCALFEHRTEPLNHPRAMAVSRRSAEIFQQLGLRERMRQSPVEPGEYDLAIWAESLCGDIHGRVPWRPDDPSVVPYAGYHCPQTLTERVLLEALEREGEASIFFDHEVRCLEDGTESVRLAVHRGRHDQTFSITARYVVAADGAGSLARHLLGIDAVGPGDLGHFLNTYFRAPYGAHLRDRRAVLNNLLREDLFEIFVAVNGEDLWLMHHFLQPDEKPADYTAERLAGIVREASGLPDVPVEVLGVTQWVMSPKIASVFRKGRIFLTGDAAARLSPAAGLGMNTGLQSAHNLAWKLAAVLRGAPAMLLDSYDAERRGHVMETFETSNEFGSEVWEILEAGFGGNFARVRDLVANSRRGGGGLGLDLGFAYGSGAFLGAASTVPRNVDVYTPTADPGRRAPHLWLEREGARISILDFFGGGFALVVSEDAGPWRKVVDPVEQFAGFELGIYQVGGDGGFHDIDGTFGALYGLQAGEAALVRPDGVVGWRGRDPLALHGAVQSILAGG